MQLNPLPKVICSLQAWKGDDDKSSVVENELLVLKQVCLRDSQTDTPPQLHMYMYTAINQARKQYFNYAADST